MRAQQLLVDPVGYPLLARKMLEIIGVAKERNKQKKEQVIDTVTQKPKGASDSGLLKDGTEVIYQITNRLKKEKADI